MYSHYHCHGPVASFQSVDDRMRMRTGVYLEIMCFTLNCDNWQIILNLAFVLQIFDQLAFKSPVRSLLPLTYTELHPTVHLPQKGRNVLLKLSWRPRQLEGENQEATYLGRDMLGRKLRNYELWLAESLTGSLVISCAFWKVVLRKLLLLRLIKYLRLLSKTEPSHVSANFWSQSTERDLYNAGA